MTLPRNKDFFMHLFRSKAFVIFTHGLCWLLFFSLPILFFNQENDNGPIIDFLKLPEYWIFYGIFLFLFYFHTYVLFPYLFLVKKYFSYIGILLLLFTAVYQLKPFHYLLRQVNHPSARPPNSNLPPGRPLPLPGNNRRLPPPPGGDKDHFDIVSNFLFIMMVALSMAIEMTRQWRITQQRALQAEADKAAAEAGKATAELSFLKAQINPHFLFNILNNIYSLAVTQNEKTAEAILKLSNTMRYLTDEVKADYVPLKREVDYIQDYIDLQRLRLSKKIELNFSVEGHLENKKIAPLILITFVENVFKYGLSNHQESLITIRLRAEAHQLVFMCQNPIIQSETPLERIGIGLTNTKDRLQFLYPGKHNLTISTEKGVFTVILILRD